MESRRESCADHRRCPWDGAEHARTFVAAGARVIVTDVRDEEGKQLAAEFGDEAVYLSLDVTDPDARSAVVSRSEQIFGPITVLVNNAGYWGPWADVATMKVDDYRSTIAINQHGPSSGCDR